MTDEERAIDLTSKSFEMDKTPVEWYCKLYMNSRMSEIHTFYNGVLVGLAEGRKEIEIKEAVIKYWKKHYKYKSNDVIELQKEIEELKAHCKAVDDVNKKMRCCGNCKHVYKDCAKEKDCKQNKYKHWELAE